MALILLTAGFIAIAMLIMAVGAIFKRKCLRGSCGGPEIFDSEGHSLLCDGCPRREDLEQQHAASASSE